MGPIPDSRSGVRLKEGATVFNKENCQWGNGRRFTKPIKYHSADLNEALTYERKPMKNPRGIYVSIEGDLYDVIKRKAQEQEEKTSMASLIRDLLEDAFLEKSKR